MARSREQLEFTAAVFVAHGGKVVRIDLRQPDGWLPAGGRIELNEDPEPSALREEILAATPSRRAALR